MARITPHPHRFLKANTGFMSSFGSKTSALAKRAFDLMAALFGLILLSPLFALIAILIKRDSPGPVFYYGARIGQNGCVFKMLKFRTMYETESSYQGLPVTCEQDDRITPFGKYLRDTKLNELPQLWNVLVGEMSMVGPRPEDPAICKTWPTKIARELLSVRPGITSPASILYRDEERMLHAGDVMRKYLHELSPDKMRLDQLYVRYRSLWLDIDVILWTILLLLPKIGAYSPPEQFLFVGPISRLVQRFVGWFIADFLIVLASISITGATVRLFGPLHLGWTGALGMALRFSALYACVGIILQTYRVHWSKATPWEAVRLGLNWLIATTLTITVHYYLEIESLAVFAIIVIASMLSLSGIVFIRYRRRLIDGFLSRWLVSRLRSPATRERVIIVGSGRTAEHIAWLMQHPSYAQKFRVLGFIDDDLRSQGMKIYGSKVIGILSDLPQIIQKQDVGLVILADFRTAARKFKEFCEAAKFKPAKVVVAPDIYGALSGLGRVSARDGVTAELKDFQCRHCLARYAALEDASADILEVQNMNITLTGDF